MLRFTRFIKQAKLVRFKSSDTTIAHFIRNHTQPMVCAPHGAFRKLIEDEKLPHVIFVDEESKELYHFELLGKQKNRVYLPFVFHAMNYWHRTTPTEMEYQPIQLVDYRERPSNDPETTPTQHDILEPIQYKPREEGDRSFNMQFLSKQTFEDGEMIYTRPKEGAPIPFTASYPSFVNDRTMNVDEPFTIRDKYMDESRIFIHRFIAARKEDNNEYQFFAFHFKDHPKMPTKGYFVFYELVSVLDPYSPKRYVIVSHRNSWKEADATAQPLLERYKKRHLGGARLKLDLDKREWSIFDASDEFGPTNTRLILKVMHKIFPAYKSTISDQSNDFEEEHSILYSERNRYPISELLKNAFFK